jgi:hypothetical protein
VGDFEEFYTEKLSNEPPFDRLLALYSGYLAPLEDMVAPKREGDDVTIRRSISLAREGHFRLWSLIWRAEIALSKGQIRDHAERQTLVTEDFD